MQQRLSANDINTVSTLISSHGPGFTGPPIINQISEEAAMSNNPIDIHCHYFSGKYASRELVEIGCSVLSEGLD